MKTLRLVLLTLVLPLLAHARPVVLEESATFSPPPDISWEFLGRFGVAIDGDYALVSGERYVLDPATPGGIRHDGAVFIYKRSGAAWNYLGRLGPINPIAQFRTGGLAMKGGYAVTITDRWRIWKRTGDSFALEPVAHI